MVVVGGAAVVVVVGGVVVAGVLTLEATMVVPTRTSTEATFALTRKSWEPARTLTSKVSGSVVSSPMYRPSSTSFADEAPATSTARTNVVGVAGASASDDSAMVGAMASAT